MSIRGNGRRPMGRRALASVDAAGMRGRSYDRAMVAFASAGFEVCGYAQEGRSGFVQEFRKEGTGERYSVKVSRGMVTAVTGRKVLGGNSAESEASSRVALSGSLGERIGILLEDKGFSSGDYRVDVYDEGRKVKVFVDGYWKHEHAWVDEVMKGMGYTLAGTEGKSASRTGEDFDVMFSCTYVYTRPVGRHISGAYGSRSAESAVSKDGVVSNRALLVKAIKEMAVCDGRYEDVKDVPQKVINDGVHDYKLVNSKWVIKYAGSAKGDYAEKIHKAIEEGKSEDDAVLESRILDDPPFLHTFDAGKYGMLNLVFKDE